MNCNFFGYITLRFQTMSDCPPGCRVNFNIFLTVVTFFSMFIKQDSTCLYPTDIRKNNRGKKPKIKT